MGVNQNNKDKYKNLWFKFSKKSHKSEKCDLEKEWNNTEYKYNSCECHTLFKLLEELDKTKYKTFRIEYLKLQIRCKNIKRCLYEGELCWNELIKSYIKKRIITIGENMKVFWILDKNNIWIETDGKSKFINILYNWFEPQLKASKELYEIDINTMTKDNDNQPDIIKEQNKLNKESEKILAKYNRTILKAQTSATYEKMIKGLICYNCMNNTDEPVNPLLPKYSQHFK